VWVIGHTLHEVFILREGRFARIPDIVVWPGMFFNNNNNNNNSTVIPAIIVCCVDMYNAAKPLGTLWSILVGGV